MMRSWEGARAVRRSCCFPPPFHGKKYLLSVCPIRICLTSKTPAPVRKRTPFGAKMGIDSTTETLESYFHPDSSKDMKLQERQTIVVVVFIILLLGGFVFYIVAEVMERRGANAKNANMNKAKLSPTPKNAPVNRFRDSKGGRLDTSVLRTSAAGTDVIV